MEATKPFIKTTVSDQRVCFNDTFMSANAAK